jgi:hypothetical protein
MIYFKTWVGLGGFEATIMEIRSIFSLSDWAGFYSILFSILGESPFVMY